MAMHPSPAQPQPEAPSLLPALAKGNQSLQGSELLRSGSPSAADLSDSCSFASAVSQDLSDALPEEEDLGVLPPPPVTLCKAQYIPATSAVPLC